MEIKISTEKVQTRGKLFSFAIDERFVDVLFLYHALERAQKWELSIEQIAETLFFPDEVLKGHFNRFIAHKIYNEHVLRAVYEYDNNVPVLVTV
ncbi:MAG: DUF4258 domain-containing protein, partial [Deltaproteobacteria bacterium]|nr:DUF4258 domain-containing protein [Candidatus Desulfacyla euxinica]